MEQEAENNEDESYYITNSPIRRGKSNQKGLTHNPSNLAIENAGNQQNQIFGNHSPSSNGLNMNGGKLGVNKKSNAHLNVNNNGTIGNNHGYGPIGGNMLNMKN